MGDRGHSVSSTPEVANFFSALADDTRLAIIQLLAFSDRKAGELGAALRLPSNALSYHMKRLCALGVVRSRHSSADARDVYYHLNVERLRRLYSITGDVLYPGLLFSGDAASDGLNEGRASPSTTPAARTLARSLRVLFLCTHNSARSQLAEALLRQMGGDQVEVYSAGSQPTEVHPDPLTTLRDLGIDPQGLYAKPLSHFISQRFDYVITVCDRVREMCPAFVGDPAQAHWSIPDPTLVDDPEQRAKAFRDVAAELQTRIRYLLLLPHPSTGERFRTPSL